MNNDDDNDRWLRGLLRHYTAPICLSLDTIGPNRERVYERRPHRDFFLPPAVETPRPNLVGNEPEMAVEAKSCTDPNQLSFDFGGGDNE